MIIGTVKKHEELLCAYRDLRSQVEMLGRDDLDLGPDEHELIMTEAELQSSQQREIVKLQSELHNIKINNKLVRGGTVTGPPQFATHILLLPKVSNYKPNTLYIPIRKQWK